VFLVAPSLIANLAAQAPRQIAQNAFRSVVLLVLEDSRGQPVSLGSGFFVAPGTIATNLHVTKDAAGGYARLIGQKKKYEIRGVVGMDSEKDLVLLAVVGPPAPPLTLADSAQMAVGDEVFAVGNPEGLEGTFSQGIVSGIRDASGVTLLQITAPISPGSSGGPVLNTQGRVVGIAVATFRSGQNLNFAVPSSYLKSLLTSIKPVSPLSEVRSYISSRSALENIGNPTRDALVGSNVVWTFGFGISGQYSFSLTNNLRTSVKDVYCAVIFYDRSGSPIETDVVRFTGVVPAGLARRITGEVDSSVQKLTTRDGADSPSTKVEFRVLDFKLTD